MYAATRRVLSRRAARVARGVDAAGISKTVRAATPFQAGHHHHHHHHYHHQLVRWFAARKGGGGDDDKDSKIDGELDLLEDVGKAYDPVRVRGGGKKKAMKLKRKSLDDDDDDDDDLEKIRSLRKEKSSAFAASMIPKTLVDEDNDIQDPLSHLLSLEEVDASEQLQQMTPSKVDQAKRKAERKQEMDQKEGRGWTDPWKMTDMYESTISFDDLPEWSPKVVSRISQERVQILPDKIPTLEALAHLPLPPPPHPHPGHGQTKAYALHRSRELYHNIYEKVAALAAPRVQAIQALPTWQDKQDAVDELFERIEFTLQEQEVILGKQPKFGRWVERALENYLKSIQRQQRKEAAADGDDDSKASDGSSSSSSSSDESDNDEDSMADDTAVDEKEDKAAKAAATTGFPTKEQDANATPIFMDCFDESTNDDESGGDDQGNRVPAILKPLAPLARGANQGRMLEEWSLAAHKTTKRILLRQSTRAAAQFMQTHEASRILLTGRKGNGKTAALLSLVAAARKSGHIVLYMPHTSMLAEHGFYIEPSTHRPGIFDLPVLSQQICGELLESHEDDLVAIKVNKDILKEFFSADQLNKSLENVDKMNVADLLKLGKEKRPLAPMCYSAAIDTLMKQDIKPFTMVVDEFNTLFHHGKYFHEEYDNEVRKPIPYNQINLFKPALDAMGLISSTKELLPEPVLMKRGAVIGAMSLSKPVSVKTNEGLVTCANELAAAPDSNMLVSNVPRLSNLEVDHIMANYEVIGFGKLRMDQGETVTNEKEVAYLRAISSNVPQELMNACVM